MTFIHKLLRALSPELAHTIAICGMRLLQYWKYKVCIGRDELSRPLIVVGEPTEVLGLSFRNRLGVAAGLDKNAQVFGAIRSLGFGFAEVGTVTPLAQTGNPKPRLFRVPDSSLVNHMGFNSCGLDKFRQNVESYIRMTSDFPVWANIGKNKTTPEDAAIEDYHRGFFALQDLVDGFVVNLSSPNTPGLRDLQSSAFIEAIGKVAPRTKPILIKLAPDLSDEMLQELCSFINGQELIDGVVLTNTSRALASEQQFEVGGYSGPKLLSRSLQCVGMARAVLKPSKVIIGVGGVSQAADVKLMRQAGADLVEVYTAFIYQGPGIIQNLLGPGNSGA